MTINGSTNNSAWTYKLEVTETATSIQNNTSTVQVIAYIGRANSTSWIAGDYSLNVTCDGQSSNYNGNLPYQTWIGGGEWKDLHTFTFTVTHNTDGTKIANISSNLTSDSFTPSYGGASGTITLTPLHKPPTIQTAEMVETDANMISLGVPNTTIVQYLSKKTITLHGTAEDGATLTYRLEHFGTNYNIPTTGYQSSNVFNADYTQNNITISNDGKANIVQKLKDSLNGETTDWVYVNINNTPQKPNGIAYTKPSIERTSTNIKRKSGVYSETLQRIANLTDNIVSLNLKGNIYKANDIIGNNNSITQIGYKIWATDDTEPSNYTTLTPTIDSSGNITISNFEIASILFTKVYNYKIIIKDYYNYEIIIDDGIVPTGQPVWSEYKDRIDVIRLTVGGYNPFEYNEVEEIIVGIYNDGHDEMPIYRKVFAGTSTINDGVSIDIASLGVDFILNAYGWVHSTYGQWWPIDNHYPPDTNYDTSTVYTSSSFAVHCESYFSYPEYRIVLEYIKN